MFVCGICIGQAVVVFVCENHWTGPVLAVVIQVIACVCVQIHRTKLVKLVGTYSVYT